MSDAPHVDRCEACRDVTDNGIIWESLPVPVFGNVRSALVKVATIALNPAGSEFFVGGNVKTREERLPLLRDYFRDYQKLNRKALESNDIKDAQERRNNYFCTAQGTQRKFYHSWFDPLESILLGMNPDWSYFKGTAVHIDVVACATKSAWRTVPDQAKMALQHNCQKHFRHTLAGLPAGTILLSNGVEPKEIPVKIDGFESVVVPPRLTVWRGTSSLNNRSFTFFGWSVTAKYLTEVQKAFLFAVVERNSFSPVISSAGISS